MSPAAAEMDRVMAKSNAMMAETYQKHPSLGPSPFTPAAQQATKLRDMADAIERTEFENWADGLRLARIEVLSRCESRIAAQQKIVQ
jgi:hypothetical protein